MLEEQYGNGSTKQIVYVVSSGYVDWDILLWTLYLKVCCVMVLEWWLYIFTVVKECTI